MLVELAGPILPGRSLDEPPVARPPVQAGGHSAPPRGLSRTNDEGEPIWGDRDVPDLAAIARLGVPFWLAGAYGHPERLREAWRLSVPSSWQTVPVLPQFVVGLEWVPGGAQAGPLRPVQPRPVPQARPVGLHGGLGACWGGSW